MPASIAAWMVAMLSPSSVGPYRSDIPMAPSPSADTRGPEAPSALVFMTLRMRRSHARGNRPSGVTSRLSVAVPMEEREQPLAVALRRLRTPQDPAPDLLV